MGAADFVGVYVYFSFGCMYFVVLRKLAPSLFIKNFDASYYPKILKDVPLFL